MLQLDLLSAPEISAQQPVSLYRSFLPAELADRLLTESIALDWQQNSIIILLLWNSNEFN